MSNIETVLKEHNRETMIVIDEALAAIYSLTKVDSGLLTSENDYNSKAIQIQYR